MPTQLIYMSQPFGFDDAMLGGILDAARRNNRRDGITGALICRHDIYLQLLEGEDAPIQAAYERIARDDRNQRPIAGAPSRGADSLVRRSTSGAETPVEIG